MVRAVLQDKRVWYLAFAETTVWAGLYYFFPAMLLRWETEFGWSKTELTLSATIALLTTAVVAPQVGKLIDRDLGRWVLSGSAALGGVMLIALTFVETKVQFITVWVGIGIAMGGALYEPCFAFLTHMRGVSAKSAITFITLVAGLAGTVSFPLSNIIAEVSNWRVSALTFAGLIFCIAVPLFWVGTRREASDNPPDAAHPTLGTGAPSALNQALRHPGFWLLAIGFATLALNHGIIVNHFLPLMDERGMSDALALFAVSLLGPMQVAGRIFMILTERRLGMIVMGGLTFVVMACAAYLLEEAAVFPILVYLFVLFQGAGYGITSITRPVVTVMLLGQRGFGAISGAIALPFVTATALAPSVGSLVWSWGGYDLVIEFVAWVMIFGLACYLGAVALLRRRPMKS